MSNDQFHMYLGTFTPEFDMGPDWNGTPSEGIYRFRFDAASGEIGPLGVTSGLLSPSWLALHPNLPVLYALERELVVTDLAVGALSAYRIDESTGSLTLMSRTSSIGDSPSHVSVHPTGRHAYATHYRSGHVVAFPLDANGDVGEVDTVILHKGASSHERQVGPHPHQVRPAPHGRFVTVSDLGLDQILIYPTDPADGALSPTPSQIASTPPGTGPRHHVRHPSGRWLFACGEINSTLCVFDYDEEEGRLRFVDAVSTLPPGMVDPSSTTAQVLVHPSGDTVYVSNRGHDSIAAFAFDEESGRATFLGTQETFGHVPRNFSIDPTGQFLIAANQNPGSLVRFRFSSANHWPEPDNFEIDVPTPSCIIFRPTSA